MTDGFVGALRFSAVSVALACLALGNTQAQSSLPTIATTALPQGASVNTGSATISTTGAQMAIAQSSDKASINWQSFSVGTGASVNIAQPSASAVLLNRVMGNDPSQILGKLSANGQVILLNPNGILFGKDGSVTASAFTASTFGLSDVDFMNGFYKYNRNGSTASVVNQGTIEVASGGFVALVGATVTNEGKIIAPQGDVVLAAAESVTLPEEFATPKPNTAANTVSVRLSKRVRLELDPAAINTAVNNTESGVIVTEGGQVLLQAAALSTAVASVTHSGSIDTSAPQAGAVTVLAEGSIVKVNGSITANSNGSDGQGQQRKGGDIIIGRDEETGALAKLTDVRGAKLESQHGFIETSGEYLKTDGISVKAKEWLLDPSDITISSSADSNVTGVSPADITPNGATGTSSVVNVSTIQNAINSGTNVTIKTTNASNTTGAGNITIASALAFNNQGSTDATLSLIADNGITQNAAASITTNVASAKLVNINMTASGNYQGSATAHANSAGIELRSTINTNGQVTLDGTSNNTGGGSGVKFVGGSGITAASYAINGNKLGTATNSYGVLFATGTSSLVSTGTSSINGVSNGSTGAFAVGLMVDNGATLTLDAGAGSLVAKGSNPNATYQTGVRIGNGSIATITTKGNVTLGAKEDNSNFSLRSGVVTADSGSLTILGQSSYTSGISFFDGTSSVKSNNGASITLDGVATAGTSYGVVLNNTFIDAGTTGDISIIGTSVGNYGIYNPWTGSGAYNMKLVGRNISINGTTSGTNASGFYSYVGSGAGNIITAAGDISITGTANGTGTGSGLYFGTTNWQTYVNSYTAGGSIALSGTNTSATNTAEAVRLFGVQAKTTGAGNISVNAGTQNASVNAITIYSAGALTNGYQGGATSLVSTSGDVKIQTNQGGITLNDGVPNSVTPTTISGRNVSIDNTGGTIDATTGVIGKGLGVSASGNSGINIKDARAITATGNINLYGVGTSGSGVEISGAATLAASNININGENTGASGAAININSASSTLNSTDATTLTAGGTGSGTSLTAAGNVSIGTQLKVTTPAASTISGLISGNGSLLKMGTGLTKLTAYDGTTYGTNTFTGGITISQGTLVLGNGNGNYNKTAGAGVITLGDANTNTNNISLLIDKGKDAGQAALTRSITVSNNGTGTVTLGAAAYAPGTGWTLMNSAIDLNRDVIFTDATGDRLGLDGALTGTGNITIGGTSSRITMGSSKTFTGNVTIAAGNTLQAANVFRSAINMDINGTLNLNGGSQAINNLTGTSTGRVINGGTLTVGSNNGGGTFAGIISNGTKLIKNGTGTLILTGSNTYTGGTDVGAGILQIGDGTNNGQIGANTVDIASGATLNFNVKSASSANYSTTNTFTGTGTLRKTGTGTLTWGSAMGVFAMTNGLIDVQGGTFVGSNSGNENWANNKASLNVASGATFQGVEGSIVVDALTGSGTVSSGYSGFPYGLTVGVNNSSGTFSGVIQDANGQAAKLTKTGTGTQTLNGANTYTGTTTISGGTLQVGNGNTTGTLGTGTIVNNAALTFNRSNSLTVGNTINGTGTLTQVGLGTTILTGANSYTGTTTISAGTLQVGNGGASGAIGTGAVIDNGALIINRDATTDILIAGDISGSGTVTQTGAGKTILSGTNSYLGSTSVSGGTLQIGNAGTTGTVGSGNVILNNNATLSYVRSVATQIANTISGAGNVSARITGANSHLTVDHSITLTGGTVNLVTDGNLSITQPISTTNGSNAAAFFVAGKSESVGTATGGDVTISGAGSVTVGSNGRITFVTGSMAGSTGLGISAGFYRYNSDEQTANYDPTGLGAGTYAIYREAPTLAVTFNNASKTYNGRTYSGGNGITVAVTGLINGDSDAQVGNIIYNGSSQSAINVGDYIISGTAVSRLGYALTYSSGTLSVGKANLAAVGTKIYDASDAFLGNNFTSINGVNGETFTASGSATLSSANVQTNQVLSSLGSLSLTGANGALTSNYNNLTEAQTSISVTPRTLTVTGANATTTYDGSVQNNSAATISGKQGADSFTVTGYGFGTNASNSSYADSLSIASNGSTLLSNYNINYVNGGLTIGKANLTLSGTRVYDSNTTFAGAYLTATGVNNETFSINGVGDSSNLLSKNAQVNQVLNSVTGLSLGSSSNGGLSNNYNTLTRNGSNVNVTPKDATVSATTTNLIYNGLTQNQDNHTSTGFLNTDDIVITGHASGKTVNIYTSNLIVGGNDASNYHIAVQNADLVINKAPLTVTANQVSKIYDGKSNALGTPTIAVLAGAGAGDIVNAPGVQSFTDANAGTNKTVTASAVSITHSSGLDVTSNYDISYISNTTSTINKAPLTIKANDDARFVTLSDTVGFNGASYIGLVGAETSSALGGALSITRQNANTNVAAGTYSGTLAPSGHTSSNYDISYTNGNYTIVQANTLLIRTTNQTLTYSSTPTFNTTAQYLDGGSNVIYTLTQSGTANNYTFSDVAGGSASMTLKPYTSAGTLATNSTSGNIAVGSYKVQASNTTVVGSNFNGSPVFVGALNVTPRAVTANASNVSKVYDGTTLMSNVIVDFTGNLAYDNLSISGTGAFSQKNVGQGLSYTIANIALGGSDAGNYYLNGANSLTGTNGAITPASLVLSTSNVTKIYDGTTAAAGSLQLLQGTQLFGSDTLGGGTFAFTNPSVGVGNKVVAVSGAIIEDGNGGDNYAISYVNNTQSSITGNKSSVTPPPVPVIPSNMGFGANAEFRASTLTGGPLLGEPTINYQGLESCKPAAASECICKLQSSTLSDKSAICESSISRRSVNSNASGKKSES